MRTLRLLLYFLFVTTSLCAQRSLDLTKSGILTFEYSVDYEVLKWSDSSEYQFLVVTVKQPNIRDSVSDSFVQPMHNNHYYSNLYEFYVKQDDCHLYPIRFIYGSMLDTVNDTHYATMKGIYLCNDFKSNVDSLELVLIAHSGYHLESQMNSLVHHVQLSFNPSKEITPRNLRATTKWYKSWLKMECEIYNPRLYYKKNLGCD